MTSPSVYSLLQKESNPDESKHITKAQKSSWKMKVPENGLKNMDDQTRGRKDRSCERMIKECMSVPYSNKFTELIKGQAEGLIWIYKFYIPNH